MIPLFEWSAHTAPNLGTDVKPPYDSIPPALDDFLNACQGDDRPFDQRIDQLLVNLTPAEIAAGLKQVVAEGDPADWTAALQLVGMLASEHQALWQTLIDAIEHRHDLDFAALMEGIVLLKQAGRLPETGRCGELAEEWAEIADSETDEIETLVQLVEEDPDAATEWLGEVENWTAAERAQLISQLGTLPASHGRDLLIGWLESLNSQPTNSTGPDSGEGAGPIMPAPNHPLRAVHDHQIALADTQALWASDLALDGTFGAGAELNAPVRRGFVLAGSTASGIRYAQSFELAAGETFEPRMPGDRLITWHPVYVRQMMRELASAATTEAEANIRAGADFEPLRDVLANHAAFDAAHWERWTRDLVENNPLDRRPTALQADAEMALGGLGHWLIVDADTRELASELPASSARGSQDRLRAVTRVWFERFLGPRMAGVIRSLGTMSYFWMSLGDTPREAESDRWQAMARASARLAADLSDPSRVVANHPFVETWIRLLFEKAMKG